MRARTVRRTKSNPENSSRVGGSCTDFWIWHRIWLLTPTRNLVSRHARHERSYVAAFASITLFSGKKVVAPPRGGRNRWRPSRNPGCRFSRSRIQGVVKLVERIDIDLLGPFAPSLRLQMIRHPGIGGRVSDAPRHLQSVEKRQHAGSKRQFGFVLPREKTTPAIEK